MARVLHVGPCDSPGGMATVMQTLASHPPIGWEAELLASHVVGSPWAKWRTYRRARKELIRRCRSTSERPEVVHIHTAADWSWWRKSRMIRFCQQASIPVIVHIHSGKFARWVGTKHSRRSKSIAALLSHPQTQGVSLNETWRETFRGIIGETLAINNPIDPRIQLFEGQREENHLLIMGRADPTKGHAFAQKLGIHLKQGLPNLKLTLTGEDHADEPWIHAEGWVSHERRQHLMETCSLLLVPSAFEGQPLVMLEALAFGLPVCVSDQIQDIPSTVRSARYEDLEDWSQQVLNVLKSPPSSEELYEASLPFLIENVQGKWKEVYESF